MQSGQSNPSHTLVFCDIMLLVVHFFAAESLSTLKSKNVRSEVLNRLKNIGALNKI